MPRGRAAAMRGRAAARRRRGALRALPAPAIRGAARRRRRAGSGRRVRRSDPHCGISRALLPSSSFFLNPFRRTDSTGSDLAIDLLAFSSVVRADWSAASDCSWILHLQQSCKVRFLRWQLDQIRRIFQLRLLFLCRSNLAAFRALMSLS